MIKSAKQCLRQLHITVQTAETAAKSSTPSTSAIYWLNPEMVFFNLFFIFKLFFILVNRVRKLVLILFIKIK